jgi:membrane-bound serine protease (ClpP class)
VNADPHWIELVVHFITNPLVAPVLLALGILAILAEIKAGAHGLGLLLGLVLFGLFYGSSIILGLAGWQEVILLGIGVVALAIETLVIPGFGVAGIIGLACIAVSTVLALVGPTPTWGDVVQAVASLGASALLIGVVGYAWIRHLPNSGRFAGLLLKTSVGSAEGFIAAPARADLVGCNGVAATDLRPAGTAVIEGERLDVVTEGEYLPAGARVQVVRSEGYRHVVRGIKLVAS